jgi:hypothetical protein
MLSMSAFIANYPLLVLVLSFAVMWLSARVGVLVAKRHATTDVGARETFGVVQAASLTLLGLIIGFAFSMAISRYDQRKNLEEEEANAIGTEYVRADLLPAPDADKTRKLLAQYLELRVENYQATAAEVVRANDARTARVQSELWATVRGPAAADPTTVSAIVLVGMNDVLNSQGYTQAAWWNRIPQAAWLLMLLIGICCNALVGYGAQNPKAGRGQLVILPVVVAISFGLIADIDSPRGGLIRVAPLNLIALADSLRAP